MSYHQLRKKLGIPLKISMRTILEDSGINRIHWDKIVFVSALTLNQILTHRAKKSPFDLFKNRTIPLSELGVLVGYNEELQSYDHVLTDSGRIVSTKNVHFLEPINLQIGIYPFTKKMTGQLRSSLLKLLKILIHVLSLLAWNHKFLKN
ncbi:hypothetical protein VP01_2137g2 [Puccinia sorghi]|uniref:Uncharacterized protein n=1 Tax=Puccinia sorghi TaxID=27349 RepID=A0A0L6V9Y0_9BASI|nr:hypothetical protein VP01_2137g2 [Puccinia sorghi]